MLWEGGRRIGDLVGVNSFDVVFVRVPRSADFDKLVTQIDCLLTGTKSMRVPSKKHFGLSDQYHLRAHAKRKKDEGRRKDEEL